MYKTKLKIITMITGAILTGAFMVTTPIMAAESDDISDEEVTVVPSESKTVEVPLDKDYKSGKFAMTFEYNEDYTVTVTSPDGREYEATFISDTYAECVVEDIVKGQWKVTIVRPEQEATDDYIEREISKVQVRLEGSVESLVDVTKDITIATDIAGLKMYFKDDSFVAEWTDTTCGSVDIEVVNAKNLQKIDTQKVDGTHYECDLTEDIQEILVTIVPAVSKNVSGAESTYNFKFDNHPNATVVYEELEITNHDNLLMSCEMGDSYAVQILVNNKEVEKTDLLDKGTHDFEIPIEPGTNNIKTYVIDADGNMRSTSYTVEKDVVAPQLELKSTYQDIKTEDEYITIEGAVMDFDYLQINNSQVEVEGDNTFKFDYKLKEGINNIAVIASDRAGNETEYDIVVERIIPEENPIPWLKIIIIACIIGIAGIYIFEIIRRRNGGGTDDKQPKSRRKPPKDELPKFNTEKLNLSFSEKNEILKGSNLNLIWEIFSFLIPVVTVYVIVTYIIMISVVQSGSMEPTLKTGNTTFYNRLAYTNSAPQRGDVVVFYSDEMNEYMGKRIIGIPGDKIEFKDGYVVINGQYCDETDYIDPAVETNCTKTFEVPADCYFMLGDNRVYSYDSRYWQNPYINFEKIEGRYMGQIDFSVQFDILHNY